MLILTIGHKGMLGHIFLKDDLIKAIKESIPQNDVPLLDSCKKSGVDVEDVDIRDIDSVRSCIKNYSPDIVINAAAYTNVDGAEEDTETAFAVNAQGAKNVALIAMESGAKSVYFSTDFVFEGNKETPYVEDDEPNPKGVYAKSKLEGERAVLETDPKALVIRTAWLYGLNGPNFVETMLKLADQKDELGIVDDQRGSPTWTWNLAQAALKLVLLFDAEGIVHATNSGDVTWCGFAKKIFEMSGKSVKVNPISTEELGRPAPRPAYSVLDNSKYERITGEKMPSWETALEGYLKARMESAS